MKVVLLAGGFGTRISEESQYRPKPMIEIGGKPILWHIMKEYSYYGFNEFIICAGYKQEMIKKYFADYFLHNSDMTFDFTQGRNDITIHSQSCEPWKVTVVDTGLNTMTGGRIKRIQKYVGNETFMMTYGDGVCDVNIRDLLNFHKNHGKKATLTAVLQDQSKGVLDMHSFEKNPRNTLIDIFKQLISKVDSKIPFYFDYQHPDYSVLFIFYFWLRKTLNYFTNELYI